MTSDRHDDEPAHEHAHAEEFPRLETVDLVARGLKREERATRWRERAQSLCVGLAVALIASGLPTEILVGRTRSVVPDDATDLLFGDLLPRALARGIAALTGLSNERAWFALSATALGITTALLHRFARRRGAPHTLAAAALLAIVLAPTTWVAGTTPGTAGTTLLGATLVFLALARDDEDAGSFGLAAVGAGMIASWLGTPNVLLWPAILARVACRIRRWPAWSVVVLGCCLLVLCVRSVGWRGFDPALDAGAATAPANPWIDGGILVGLLAGLVLARRRRTFDARLATWAVFAAAPLLATGSVDGGRDEWPDLAWVPLAFLGLFAAGARARWVVVVALVASVAAHSLLARVDVHRAWRERIEERLEPGDVVVVDDARHAYLLRERYGLRVLHLRRPPGVSAQLDEALVDSMIARMSAARSAGARVVLDVALVPGWLSADLRTELARHADVDLATTPP